MVNTNTAAEYERSTYRCTAPRRGTGDSRRWSSLIVIHVSTVLGSSSAACSTIPCWESFVGRPASEASRASTCDPFSSPLSTTSTSSSRTSSFWNRQRGHVVSMYCRGETWSSSCTAGLHSRPSSCRRPPHSICRSPQQSHRSRHSSPASFSSVTSLSARDVTVNNRSSFLSISRYRFCISKSAAASAAVCR